MGYQRYRCLECDLECVSAALVLSHIGNTDHHMVRDKSGITAPEKGTRTTMHGTNRRASPVNGDRANGNADTQ